MNAIHFLKVEFVAEIVLRFFFYPVPQGFAFVDSHTKCKSSYASWLHSFFSINVSASLMLYFVYKYMQRLFALENRDFADSSILDHRADCSFATVCEHSESLHKVEYCWKVNKMRFRCIQVLRLYWKSRPSREKYASLPKQAFYELLREI